jgi:hypothetical protein
VVKNKMEEIRKQIEEMIKKYTNIKLEKLKEKILLTFYTGNTIYKKIEIKKEKENLEVHIPKDKRIIEVLQISEIERIILMLYKQSISKKHSKKEIEKIKKIYIPGQKLELINLYSSFNVLLPGTKGMIEFIDDLGNIHVIWEHKKNIQLVVGIDEFKIICPLCNQELNSKKEENIYERYRERLILQDTDILLLNIFETFIDTQFIDDTYAFFTMISKNNYELALKKLIDIKENLQNNQYTYTSDELEAYEYILSGYILNLECKLNLNQDNLKNINTISKKIQQLEQADNRHQELLKDFDKEYQTDLSNTIKNTPILKSIFDDFIQQIYVRSKIYKLSEDGKNILKTEINKICTLKQQELIKQYLYYGNKISDDYIYQAFIYGYALSLQIKKETLTKNN